MDIPVAKRIILKIGDITREATDAIVNAANTSLLGGGGVDGAIHRSAGPELLAECRTLGGCETGSAKITRGCNLPAKYVIHAVGPVYRGGRAGEAKLLAGCYQTAMQLAIENNIRSIAFSAISCGIYGYPLAEAANIAIREVANALGEHNEIEQAVFVLFNQKVYDTYESAYQQLLDSK